MAIDQEKLKQGLIQDVAQAQAVAASGRMAGGAPQVSEDESFMPRAIKAQGRVMGEKELKDTQAAFGDAIENLLQETSITDKLEQDKFRSAMKKKFNQLQMLSLRKAGELRLEMKRQGLDQEKQEGISNAFGSLMESLGSGIISNLGRHQKQQEQVAREKEQLGSFW